MRIVVDTREQVPWTFEGQDVELVRAKLNAGDYSIDGLEHRIAIERKSMEDFVGTAMKSRTRFYRELELLRAYDFRCVIVEVGVTELMHGNYRSSVPPAAVLGFIAEITVRQRVPVHLAGSRAEAQVLAGAFLRAAAKIFSNQ